MPTFTICDCGCGISFVRAAPHQRFATDTCARRAARARRRAKSKNLLAGDVNGTGESHVVRTLNPTDEVLTIFAARFAADPTLKPVVFSGMFNREWQPPPGVVFDTDVESGGMIMANEAVFK